MAAVQITIKDINATEIGVDVHQMPQFPESALLYTNAQMVARDLIGMLQQLGSQINARNAQKQLIEATRN